MPKSSGLRAEKTASSMGRQSAPETVSVEVAGGWRGRRIVRPPGTEPGTIWFSQTRPHIFSNAPASPPSADSGIPGKGVQDALRPLLQAELQNWVLASLDLTKAFDHRTLLRLGMLARMVNLLLHAFASVVKPETLPSAAGRDSGDQRVEGTRKLIGPGGFSLTRSQLSYGGPAEFRSQTHTETQHQASLATLQTVAPGHLCSTALYESDPWPHTSSENDSGAQDHALTEWRRSSQHPYGMTLSLLNYVTGRDFLLEGSAGPRCTLGNVGWRLC